MPDPGAVHDLSSHPTVQQLLTRCTFPPAATPVTCAVSGGADSLALLALAVAAGCQVEAVHVDHQLRPDSQAEAEVVRAAAQRLGARYRAERVHVGEGPNLEARARDARYAVLPPDVLTGHTADDQAETVLINVLRGAGLQGLAAIRAGHRRPLLALRRIDTESVCAILGWQPVNDPSNADPRHLRNRIRHEALPQLGELAQRDLVPLLARQAALAADDADLLDELALAVDPTDAKALALAHPALARRAVRRWLTGPHPPDAATVERVLEVARGHAIATEVGSGRRVERHQQRLSLVGLRETSASEYPDQAI